MIIEKLINTLLPVVLIVACGAAYGRWRRPDMRLSNQMNMDIFVPALVFSVLASKDFDILAYQELALAATAVVLGSGLLLLPIAYLFKLNLKTFLPPMMFNNTGNMGIPLLVLAFGEQALAAAVLVFVVEMLLHFSIGIYILDPKTSLLRMLKMPIVQASLFGILFSVQNWHLPVAVALPIEMLGQISIPLMLFALGVRLLDIDFSDWKLGAFGAVACPLSGLAVVVLLTPWLTLTSLQMQVLWVFAALPPAVLNYMLAEQYQQEPARVASLVLLGNLASLVVMPWVLAYQL